MKQEKILEIIEDMPDIRIYTKEELISTLKNFEAVYLQSSNPNPYCFFNQTTRGIIRNIKSKLQTMDEGFFDIMVIVKSETFFYRSSDSDIIKDELQKKILKR